MVTIFVAPVTAPVGASLMAAAGPKLPPGFSAQVYVSGEGFDLAPARGAHGIPATSTLALDHAGALYLARTTSRRYTGAEVEDVWSIYRIPAGGARLTPATQAQFFYGPPLPNPQVAAIHAGHQVFVTTFDRDRKIGVVYRLRDGRAELFAGGTPPRDTAPLFVQPEGAAFDAAGNLFVADRNRGVVVRLDAAGRLLDPRYVAVPRPRLLAIAPSGELWIGSDGTAEAPWQSGPGEIWTVAPNAAPRMVLRGPVAAGMGIGPSGHLFVADRHAARVFMLGRDGARMDFAHFGDGDAPRSLAFAPVTEQTRRAGIAGDLFIVTIARGAWPVNQVIRVTGPFDRFVNDGQAPSR